MAIDCIEFLDFAEAIFKKANTEIEYRNIVSRSYYYSLHAITEQTPNKFKGQKELIDYLCDQNAHKNEKIDSKVLRELGLKLEQRKRQRVKSDYFLNRDVRSYEPKNAIKEAKIFKGLIDSSLEQKASHEA